ncbi:MAG: DoxX-like family protein [Bacilli bacterium]
MGQSNPIYVETLIQAEIDQVWEYTQNPSLHKQWDLRFSEIHYLPKENESAPQQFQYVTNIGFGLSICGTGENVKTIQSPDERTSGLKFWANHPLSLIKEGSGYWKYSQTERGIRFLTQYQYKVAFGVFGRLLDCVFNPLLGWATAWSFECLRLWIERGIPPRISYIRSFIQYSIGFLLAFIWMYQGLVPKILFQENGELQLLQATGSFSSKETQFLYILGAFQLLFGFCFIRYSHSIMLHRANILLILCLGMGAFSSGTEIFTAPFNPITLSVAMIGYSLIAIVNSKYLPYVKNCKRKRSVR